MALINPVYAIVVPFLFVLTIPLAIFAGITSAFAFGVLLLRVLLVYLDIAISILPKSLLGFPNRQFGTGSSPVSAIPYGDATASPAMPLRRRRRRPSSAASLASAGSTTPVADTASFGLMPSLGAERDFEGIGGWRAVGDGGENDEDDDNEDAWTAVYARTEWPDRQYRNHSRQPSGGGGTITPGDGGVYLMMKGARTTSPEAKALRPTTPNSSRQRTPSGPRMALMSMSQSDGYFPLTTGTASGSTTTAATTPKATRKVPAPLE